METRSACTPATAMAGPVATPLIVEAARRIRTNQFVLDGEAGLRISDFDGLCSGQHNDKVQLYALDIFGLDDSDLRKLPLALASQPCPTASPPRRRLQSKFTSRARCPSQGTVG